MAPEVHSAVIHRSQIKKIIISLFLGVIIPIALALFMNQAMASEIYEENAELADSAPAAKPSAASARPAASVPAATIAAQPQTSSNDGETSIFDVLTSDVATDDGYVITKKTVISTGAEKIYVTVQIMHAQPGMKVTAGITGLTNTVATPTSSAVTYKAGNIMKAFSFSNGDKPWPAGEYRVNVNLSSGVSKQVIFDIR